MIDPQTLFLLLVILIFFIAVFCLASFFINTSNPPPTRRYMTVQEIRELNQQYAAKCAKRFIEMERGKLLAFKRKDYYASSYKKKGSSNDQNS